MKLKLFVICSVFHFSTLVMGAEKALDFEGVLSFQERVRFFERMKLPENVRDHFLFVDRFTYEVNQLGKAVPNGHAMRHVLADYNMINDRKTPLSYEVKEGDVVRFADTVSHGLIRWYPAGLSRSKEEIFLTYLHELVRSSYTRAVSGWEKNASRDLKTGKGTLFVNELDSVWRTLLFSDAKAERLEAILTLNRMFSPLSIEELIREKVDSHLYSEGFLFDMKNFVCPVDVLINGQPAINLDKRHILRTDVRLKLGESRILFYSPAEDLKEKLSPSPEDPHDIPLVLGYAVKACRDFFIKNLDQFTDRNKEGNAYLVNVKGDYIEIFFDTELENWILRYNKRRRRRIQTWYEKSDYVLIDAKQYKTSIELHFFRHEEMRDAYRPENDWFPNVSYPDWKDGKAVRLTIRDVDSDILYFETYEIMRLPPEDRTKSIFARGSLLSLDGPGLTRLFQLGKILKKESKR